MGEQAFHLPQSTVALAEFVLTALQFEPKSFDLFSSLRCLLGICLHSATSTQLLHIIKAYYNTAKRAFQQRNLELPDLGDHCRRQAGEQVFEADLDRLYAAVKAERGTLDIVFANAGVGSQLPLGKITAEHIDETFDTNVKGTIFTVQKALPLMGKGGSIILTGSSAGTTGAPTMSVYSASKAAVRNLARTWAEDLKGTGIRVNVLSPGPTATELAKSALGEGGQKVYASMTPLQRMADPAEIGAAAAFLASDDSSFMTASELAVDGGLAQI